MLAAAEPGLVDLLLLLSYPLHPPQRPGELRTVHFPSLHTPAMFVHGTRNGFGSIDEMSAALKLIPARTELLQIAGAGHELMTKRNRDEAPKRVVEAFRLFAYDKVSG
jgi:uncharacterized protein